jgi:hypothetical protein
MVYIPQHVFSVFISISEWQITYKKSWGQEKALVP